MTDRNIIRDRLLQIVAEKPVIRDGWRRIGSGDDADLLAAFIAELDETILPRRLEFRNRDGAILVLEAANRRIRRFVAPVPEQLASFSTLFDGAVLTPEKEMLDRIGALLAVHLAQSPHLWVRSSQLGTGGQSAQTGISAARLHAALCVPMEPAAGTDPQQLIQRFQSKLAQECEIWVRLNGTRVEASSGKGLTDNVLENLIGADWANRMRGLTASADQPGPPCCCVLASSSEPACSIVVMVDASACFIARTSAQRAVEISNLWRQLGLSGQKDQS